MFEIQFGENGEVMLEGRMDASQATRAREFLEGVTESRVIDCARLDYISSAGLGVLLGVQKRLKGAGSELTLVGLNHHIRDVFRYAGLDQVFKIDSENH